MASTKEPSARQDPAADEVAMLEQRLNERFDEIAELTRLLADAEREQRRLADHVDWLHQLIPALRRMWKFRLLNRWHDTAVLAKLKRRKLFNADAYLAANPDVARAGIDPLHHYLNHGLQEGRPLG